MRRRDNPDPPPLAGGTAERLAAIVEAAERAAVTVIDDAEKQARRRLEEAEDEADRLVADRLYALADLTDSLIAQAEAVRDQSERWLAALEDARRKLGAAGAPERVERGQVDAPSRSSHLSAVEPPPEPGTPPPTELRPDLGEGTPAGARLLATQMAVSGSSRKEIEARLRNGFEIEDASSILDAILGPEE